MRRSFATLTLLLLAGCSAPTTSVARTTSALSPAPRAATATATATSIPSPTPPSCLSQPGQVIVEEVTAEGMARSQPYRVYLPPCYQPDAGRDYPVLILVHGLQSSDGQWDELGVDEAADAAIRAGTLAPMVIVMPWERKGLDFESSIFEVLLPHIRASYAGEGDRESTAIGGLSRGAGWALRIGLKHPDTFGSIGLHSPAVLQPDLYYIPDWVEAARESSQLPRVWIDIAERDTSRVGAQELAGLLDELGMTYAWSSAPGEHSAPYWSSRVADYLSWYGEPWQAAE